MHAAKPNPLLEITITIIAPAIVLMQLSGPRHLGDMLALVLALAFPVGFAFWDGWRRRQLSWLALVGIASTLLTGGIALLKLDSEWLAVKEGTVSALIGAVIAASAWTRHPLIHALVLDGALLDVDRIRSALAERKTASAFEARLRTGTLLLGGTFFVAAAANYLLTRWVVTSPAGTEAFDAQLGRLTLLSYTVIAIPTMAMMSALLWWLVAQARRLTGLTLTEMLGPGA